jgi:hypothetical protein
MLVEKPRRLVRGEKREVRSERFLPPPKTLIRKGFHAKTTNEKGISRQGAKT